MKIAGSTILVSGGGGEIGRHVAACLQQKGACVVIADRNIDRLVGCGLPVVQFEGTDPTSVASAVARVEKDYGGLDALINCMGYIYSEPLLNLTNPASMRHGYASFTKVIDLNLNTAFLIGSVVAESMVRRRTKGLILNFSSISARGNAGQTAYSAAKAGVEAMINVWAKELGPLGVRCVALAPGFIDTPSTRGALHEHVVKHIVSNTPLRRLGELESISEAVVFALENDFLTGTVLEVNGGMQI